MITDDGLVLERPHLGGVQRVYRFGDGGLSVINAVMAHAYPFAWEVAVVTFPGPDSDRFDLTYETPLTSDVEVFQTDDDTNEFIRQAADYFREPKQLASMAS